MTSTCLPRQSRSSTKLMPTFTKFTVQTYRYQNKYFFLIYCIQPTCFSSFQTIHSHFGYSGWNGVLGPCRQRNNYYCRYQPGNPCIHLNMPLHVTRFPAQGVQTADIHFCCNHVHCFQWCSSSNFKRDKIDRHANTRTKVSLTPVFGAAPTGWNQHSILGRVIWHLYCRCPVASQRVHVFVSWNVVCAVPTLWERVTDNIFSLQCNGQIMG